MAEKSNTRKALEAEAEGLGIKFPANIGDEKLRAKIAEAEGDGAGEQTSPQVARASSPRQAGDGSSPATQDDPKQREARAGSGQSSLDPQDPSGLVVEIIGPKAGRRRIGRRFSREPTIIPLGELSEDDKSALVADAELTFRVFEQSDED